LNRSRQWIEQLPADDYRLFNVPAAAEVAPYFRDWVEHEIDDDYWRKIRVSDFYNRMNIKALHAGGWNDIFSGGSIRNFIRRQKEAPTKEAREGQRLLMGPWAHAATSPEGKIGDVTFGRQAVLDMNDTIVKWFDFAVKRRQNELAAAPPVKIYVMRDHVWRAENGFPPASARD